MDDKEKSIDEPVRNISNELVIFMLQKKLKEISKERDEWKELYIDLNNRCADIALHKINLKTMH